jgi:phosphoserine phosphatase
MTYVVHLLSEADGHGALSRVQEALEEALKREGGAILSARRLTHDRLTADALVVATTHDRPFLMAALLKAVSDTNVDLAVQDESTFQVTKKLAVFDMDSTLIGQEVIDEMARVVGAYEAVSAVTERAMRGEFDFREALRERVALLKGADLSSLVGAVMPRLTLNRGVEQLAAALRGHGVKLAVLSGGFSPFVTPIANQLGFSYAFANTLEVADGRLTGRVTGTIVDRQRKAALLDELCEKEGLMVQEVMAVGDGANDLLMLEKAGLGVAFNAKPAVQAVAKVAINHPDMRCLLLLLGFEHDEISHWLSQ